VAGDGEPVRQLQDDARDGHKEPTRAIVGCCVARREHRAAFLIDDLNAQTFGRLFDDDVAREFGDVGHVLHGLTNSDLGAFEFGVFANLTGARQGVLRGLRLAGLLLVGVAGVRCVLRLGRLSDGRGVAFEERLLVNQYGRLRDVYEIATGEFLVLTSNRDGRGRPAADDDRILLVTLR